MLEYIRMRRLSFDKSGNLIAVCSEKEGVKVFDVNTHAVIFALNKPIKSCGLSPDGKTIAVAYASKERVHLLRTGL
jgi:WD40 repeat protein